MNQKSVTMCSVAAILLFAGCQQKPEQRVATVSMRFAMPPNSTQYAVAPVQEYQTTSAEPQDISGNQTTSSATTNSPSKCTASANTGFGELSALSQAERYFVTLWGGQFNGDDVTYRDLDLTPGDYTFAMWNQEPQSTVQGNLTVNAPSTALLEVLRRWQAQLPVLKQQLAYDAEIQGEANTNPEEFQSFQRQIRALDNLAKKIDRAVWYEQKWNKRNAPKHEEFLNQAIVLVLPGDERELDQRTRPAFCAADISRVCEGNPQTKVLVIADYDSTQWKAQMVDGFWRELSACKTVLWEEVNRLERRKRILDITDHLYKHDQAFVSNERQLQAALNTIALIDEQLTDLSARRFALAYAHALTASHEVFPSMDAEYGDLEQEKTLLTAEKARLDALYEKAGAETPKKVDLAAARQRYAQSIKQVDQRLASLNESRVVLAALRQNSQVLHRSSDARVLAAGVINEGMPFALRQAVVREAILTVRLQSQDNLFAPKDSDLAKVRTAAYTAHQPK